MTDLKTKTNYITSLSLMSALIFSTQSQAEDSFIEMSFEDLMNVEVTSVNRHSEPLLNSAAAAYVISNKDIHRSGATNIPEALRMVPGLTVSQVDSSKWIVGSRAFSSQYTNNLQVMVDGRSIYTPGFNGVYWEQLDVVMEDIERIEVIRGSGSTLWGANAVNGVINIITKSASETQGGYTQVRAGNQSRGATLRYGTQLSKTTFGRAYITGLENDDNKLASGQDSFDEHRNKQGGFRIDSSLPGGDKLTLQGDIYDARSEQLDNIPTINSPYSIDIPEEKESKGWNILGRWSKPLSLTSDMSLQMYIDYYSIDELTLSPRDVTTIDIDFQHHNTLNATHDFIWGLGYYSSRLNIETTTVAFPAEDSAERYRASGFIQDEITLIQDKLKLTIGSKFEHNNATGYEYQPNIRLLFKPTENQSLWGAASRSVRTPSIGEEIINLNIATLPPSTVLPLPNKVFMAFDQSDFDSEEITSYELGYRIIPSPSLSIDSTIYYTDYKNMLGAKSDSFEITPTHTKTLLTPNNDNSAIGRGIELSVKWQAKDNLNFVMDYAIVNNDIPTEDGIEIDSTPKQKFSLRSMLDVTPNINLDMWLRYVSDTEVTSFITTTADGNISVPSYWNMDLRIGWQVTPDVELSLLGKNLMHTQQLEGANTAFTTQVVEISRSVFGMVEVKF